MLEARHIVEATIDRVYLGLQGSMDTRELIEMVVECHNEVLVAAGIDLVPHTAPQPPAVRVKGLADKLKLAEYVMTKDSFCEAERLEEGLSVVRRIRSALEAETGGGESGCAFNNDHLAWACERWRREVAHRPLRNVHRRTLDDTWRQVIRRLGGDPNILLPMADHDSLVAKVARPATTTDERAVEVLPATKEYVDRLIRIFRDRPVDDACAIVLIDYARAALAQGESRNG